MHLMNRIAAALCCSPVLLCTVAPVSLGFAQDVVTDQVVSSRMVVDFETDKDIKIVAGLLKGRVVTVGDGRALEIESEAQGDYPWTMIEPVSGRWNLGEYDAILMDVQNLADTALRVLLRINDPGVNGRECRNTESVTIAAKRNGVLSVPYGSWHGSPGHALDRTNITGITVMLDHPEQSHHFRVDDIRAVTYERIKMSVLYQSAFYRDLKPFFGRGINLGNALDAPQEGRWGVTLKEAYFPAIRNAGFDSVRIPVSWSEHADEQPPYTIDPAFFARVDWAVACALRQELNVVLNMHHYDAFFENVKQHNARFLALWRQIAVHYRTSPQTLCFELLNEPHGNMSSPEWNRIVADTLKAVRKSNPDRWIMVGPTHFNSITKLGELELPEEDRKLVVTVHYYLPHNFTHQGASWAGEAVRQLKDIRWSGDPAERDAVRKDFDSAMAWAIRHQRPIYLGEFGSYSTAAMADRARWTRCVAGEAAAHRMGSAYWEFCSGFGAYDSQQEAWRKPLLDALIW